MRLWPSFRVCAASAWVLVAASACGGAPPPGPAVPDVPAPAASLPPPDLSPVPTPGGLIVSVRVTKPSATAKTVMGWLHAPAPGSRELGRGLAGEELGEVVDADQPVDFAVLNGGRGMTPAWAAAAGVGSLEAVRSALPRELTLAAGKGGAFWVRPTNEAEGTTDHPCEVAPAAGPTPLRLVCGASVDALEYLAPYLTRTAPRQVFDTDVHAEVHAEPLKPFARIMRTQAPQLLEQMLDLDATQGEGAAKLVEAVLGDLVDLIVDLDTVKLDVKLDPEGAKATLESAFASKTSVLARLAMAYPERQGAAPASFWRLPDDSDTAVFSHGYDPKDLEHARDLLVAAVAGALGKEGLAPADQKAIGASFDRILSNAPFVLARGSDVVAMQKALVAFQDAKGEPAKETAARAAFESYLGWWVMGFDEPPARLEGVLKALVLAANRPGTTEWLKKHVASEVARVPPPTLRMAAVPPGLPKGAMHVELAFYTRSEEAQATQVTAAPGKASQVKVIPVKATSTKPIEMHMLLVPGANSEPRTWLIVASDPKLALAKAKDVLAAAPAPGASGTLATRRGLDALREGQENGGGFSTLRAWVALSSEPPLALLAALPSQGQSPIVATTSSGPGAPGAEGATAGVTGGGTLSVHASVPRAAIEDIVFFLLKQAAAAGGAHGGGVPPAPASLGRGTPPAPPGHSGGKL